MNKIEIFTFLTRNSADYAELLRKSMERLKGGRNNLVYKCIESVGCDRLPVGWDCVASVKDDLSHNCLNHANAMHEALKHVTAAKVLFVDADMCVMCRGWDNILMYHLNNNDVWGTAFGDNSKQYHRFPNVFFFAFKKNVIEMVDLDFNPKLIPGVESPVRYKLANAKETKFFHKNAGEIIKCDTGWRLPLIIKKMGLKSGYMPRVLGSDVHSCLPFMNSEQKRFCMQKPEHMAEWHTVDKSTRGEGSLYVTHKQASRNHPLNGEWGKVWKERINLYLNKEYGFVL